ncbi:MAG: hypothetical protein Kow0056_07830 [Coriobacteriia bacterium]
MDERTKEAMEHYGDKSEDLRQLLGFYGAVWRLQSEIAAEQGDWTPPDAETLRDALVTGQHAFLVRAPEVDPAAYRDAVRRLRLLLADSEILSEETRERLAEEFESVVPDEADGIPDVEALCEAAAEKTETASEEAELVHFLFSSALTPFLVGPATAIVETLGGIDTSLWSSGECPVCGTPAYVGHIIDAGQLEGDFRYLACPLCRAEWQYDRLRCVRCGTRDHEQLHYLYEESDPAHKVHVCEACHGYIKITDQREAGRRTVPWVEDVVTVLMDDVAKDRGYTLLGDGED